VGDCGVFSVLGEISGCRGASMNMTVFWDVAPCSLVGVQYFQRRLLTLKIASISEMSAYFYQPTRHVVSKDSCVPLQSVFPFECFHYLRD
jgi:hypothetical protein